MEEEGIGITKIIPVQDYSWQREEQREYMM